MNLLNETLDFLLENNKTVEDISWLGTRYAEITLDNFYQVANVDYDNGFGSPEVATDLLIVFNDGSMMCREDYDGSENWKFISTPERPNEIINIHNIVGGMCNNLKELNE